MQKRESVPDCRSGREKEGRKEGNLVVRCPLSRVQQKTKGLPPKVIFQSCLKTYSNHLNSNQTPLLMLNFYSFLGKFICAPEAA
jgi:hypothetical protein